MYTNSTGCGAGRFEMAGGSVVGRDHLGRGACLAGKNNQDAFACGTQKDVVAAVVCDGCSAGQSSEVGAKLGARLLLGALLDAAEGTLGKPGGQSEEAVGLALEQARVRVLSTLDALLLAMGSDRLTHLRDSFLFTALGALVLKEHTAIFAIGDGVYALDGQIVRLGPYPDNAPPYLGYALVDGSARDGCWPGPRFEILRFVPTASVQTLLLATDGAWALADVFALSRFWTEEGVCENPDGIRRRLVVLNNPFRTGEGRVSLADDTTLVVIRRKGTLGGDP